MPHISEIQIRDPFVVTDHEGGRYFLYGTTDENCWEGPGVGFDAYWSADLESWSGPFQVFRPPPGFWGTTNFWAPEVHRHDGRFFMFATFKAPGLCRGTQILVSDDPLGPFMPYTTGPLTPAGWECLDGTLFRDGSGTPWLVFCHEWLQVEDGRICAVRLTDDLTAAAGEPQVLFSASEARWARCFRGERNFVTDGPFLHRAADGGLLLLWSSMGECGYAVGVARSETGGILGPWRQAANPLFKEGGGHAMIFETLRGRLMLALHAPNDTPNERARFIEPDLQAAAGL
jgi:arabinan endo-1,5-alpha-L-arabinosidase